MRRLIAIVIGGLGSLLILASFGWINLTDQFLLYLGGALLLIALLFFARG